MAPVSQLSQRLSSVGLRLSSRPSPSPSPLPSTLGGSARTRARPHLCVPTTPTSTTTQPGRLNYYDSDCHYHDSNSHSFCCKAKASRRDFEADFSFESISVVGSFVSDHAFGFAEGGVLSFSFSLCCHLALYICAADNRGRGTPTLLSLYLDVQTAESPLYEVRER